MTDFTDYHRYSWSVIAPQPKPGIIFLSRAPIYLLIFILVHFAYTSRLTQTIDPRASTFIYGIISVILCIFFLIFNHILNSIMHNAGPKLIKYRIDVGGVHINRKSFTHTNHPPLQFPNPTVQQKAEAALTHYRSQS